MNRQNETKTACLLFWVPFFCLFLLQCFSLKAMGNPETIPFSPGEKMKFIVKWEFIKAGEAVLEVLPPKEVNGVMARHFALTVTTSPFVDFFYKVRDRIESYTDMDMTRSFLYRKKQGGRKDTDIMVDFDWEKNQAQYSKKGKKRTPIPIPSNTMDPLGIFYAFRTLDIKGQKVIERPVCDGKKVVLGQLDVIRTEKIKLGGREYEALLVEPRLEHLEGVYEKSKHATLQIWVTADERRIPLRVKSSVIVGDFVGELVSIQGVKGNEDFAKIQPES